LAAKGSAAKRHTQSENRRIRNKMVKSRVRTSMRKVLELVKAGSAAQARDQYKEMSSLLDSAVSKGIVPRNTAARRKHRLHKKLEGLETTGSST
jgi:small subunit ribosomal protein S20